MEGPRRIKVDQFKGVYYYESADGRYRGKPDRSFCYSYKDAFGKLKWVTVGWESDGVTARKASLIRDEMIRTVRKGGYDVATKEITFDEAFNIYYELHSKPNKKSHIDDKQRYAKHLKNKFGHAKLSQIKPEDLERLKIDLKNKTKLSQATIRQVLMIISGVYNKMIKWPKKSGYIGTNPTKGIDLPKQEGRRERALTTEEQKRLLGVLEEINCDAWIQTMISLDTGMRIGEIFSMKVGDVDLESGFITMPRAKGGEYQKVAMTKRIQKAIVKWIKGKDRKNSLFNPNEVKRKRLGCSYKQAIAICKFNDGIDDSAQKIVEHTMRHTTATQLAKSGEIDVLSLKETMRHKSISTTLKYVHLMPDSIKKKSAALMDKINETGSE